MNSHFFLSSLTQALQVARQILLQQQQQSSAHKSLKNNDKQPATQVSAQKVLKCCSLIALEELMQDILE